MFLILKLLIHMIVVGVVLHFQPRSGGVIGILT